MNIARYAGVRLTVGVVQTAAVVGRVFWTAALSFADGGSVESVREGLRRLSRAEMVRPVKPSRSPSSSAVKTGD